MNYSDIVDVLSELGIKSVIRYDEWVSCKCPIATWTHRGGKDRHPSFGVKVNSSGFSGFNCYSCKLTGARISSLVRRYQYHSGEDMHSLIVKCDAIEALSSGDDADYYEEEEEDVAISDRVMESSFPSVLDKREAIHYLEERDITDNAAKILNLRYDEWEKRIIFPVYGSDLRLYGLVGRTILKPNEYPFANYPKVRDYSFKKRNFLFGAQLLVDSSTPILLVEGPFDVAGLLSLDDDFMHKFGVPVASMKASLSNRQADILVEAGRKVYIMYDDDDAGTAGVFGPDYLPSGKISKASAYGLLSDDLVVVVPDYPSGIVEPDGLAYDQCAEMMNQKPFVQHVA